MLSSDALWNVDYLTRLTRAMGAFESRIRQSIPDGVVFKDRSGTTSEVLPQHPRYRMLQKKFVEDVSDEKSRTILSFLYQFDCFLSKNIDAFIAQYSEIFVENQSKWDAIIYNFPKLDQTTVCSILRGFSDTAIGNRLEDLSYVGLVERNNLKPPNPKHVRISAKGLAVVEAAISDGVVHLSPVFTLDINRLPVVAQKLDRVQASNGGVS